MIDIHSHIIPGIDDGAQSMEEAAAMAETAYRSGTKIIVATPHCTPGGPYSNYYDTDLIDSYDKLKRELLRREIPLELRLGMEIFYSPEVPELLRRRKATGINHSRYILVEFDFRDTPEFINRGLKELRGTGYIPVAAHPERYPCVQHSENLVHDWIQMGCLIQMNKGSLMGRFGSKAKETSFKLLHHNMVHVIASDTHSNVYRTPSMLEAYRTVSEEFGHKLARELFEVNPGLILNNAHVSVPEPVSITEKKRFTIFRQEY